MGKVKIYTRPANRPRRFTDQEVERIITDYNEGMTYRELAVKYQVNTGTLHRAVWRYMEERRNG